MKSLILAEKPSVALSMAKVLKCNKKNKNYYEGEKYIITWALGHLATLLDPGDYEAKYRTWKMEDLPMLPGKLKIKKLKKTGHQLKTLSILAKKKDINNFIIATDAGREGELVARWAMFLAGYKGKVQRLWISSQTDKAIEEGFKDLKDGKKYWSLYEAAQCRAEADWLIGLNVTRALTCKYNVQLSAGRVQTPTLAMIVEREEEIKNFVPKNYFMIKGEFEGFFGHLIDNNGKNKFFNEELVSNILKKLEGREAKILEIDEKIKKEYAPRLYDLTELQRDANKRYGYSAKKTLSLMQTLYERHKILTYPRTDSRYITEDIVETIKERLLVLKSGPNKNIVDEILKNSFKLGKNVVDNKKVSDHHAIIPTEERADLSELSFDEKRIYNLVVKRFLAVLLPPARYKKVKVTTKVGEYRFISNGKIELDLGWKKIGSNEISDDRREDKLPEQRLKDLKLEESLIIKNIKRETGKTTPPKRFSEGTLLSAMENPSRYVQGKEDKKIISKGGLGTPATRAEIIEKLISSYYVERNKNTLIPTEKGKQLITLSPKKLTSPELTARWEERLENIATGKDKRNKFMEDIRKTATELVEWVKRQETQYEHKNLTNEKCPMCGKKMLSVKDKKGRPSLVCQDRGCGYEDKKKSKNNTGLNVSKKEKYMNKRLINQYSEEEEAVTNLGDLFSKLNIK